jgi:hypothetical protein
MRRLQWWLAASLFALALILGLIGWNAVPSTEAVRLRNALLFSERAFVDWIPPQEAAVGFKTELEPIPSEIVQAAKLVRKQLPSESAQSSLDLARALAGYISQKVTRGGRISELDVGTTYERIVRDGAGYCADVVDAYMALALASGLYVRPWAFSFDGFGGHGHIIVEVYDEERGQWVLLDVYNNVMPVERASRAPLGVPRFLALFRADPASVEFIPVAPGPLRMPVYEKLVDYYRRGIDQWYFWAGNNVVSRGSHGLVKITGSIAEPLGEFTSIVLGRFPQIVPVRTETNSAAVSAMLSLRTWLTVALVAATALSLATAILAVQLWRCWRARSSGRMVRGTVPWMRAGGR